MTKKQIINIALLAAISLSWPINVNAQTIDSHVHGLSEMFIALENKTLEIEIESPAINLVGFEHKAETKSDKAAVKKVIKLLSRHHEIFSLSGGDCSLVNSTIDASSIIDTQHQENASHKHEHGHDQHHNKEAKHYEVISSYRYHCKKPSTLTAITVNMFDQFSGVEQIETRWLTEAKQNSITLTPMKQDIKLR